MTDARLRRWPREIGLFALLAAVYSWEALLPGRVLLATSPRSFPPWSSVGPSTTGSNNLQGDSLILTHAWAQFTQSSFRAGEIPFWNPYVFCGYPHYASIQSAVLYPPAALLGPFDPSFSLVAAALIHLTLAGWLMYLFLRSVGLTAAAALIGGVCYEFNGMFLVRLATPSYLFSGVWAPLMLIGADRVASRQSWPRTWPLPVGAALSLLGGHPQIFVLCCLLAWTYLSWRSLEGRGRDRLVALGAATLRFASLLALGLAWTAYQLLPFLEFVLHSAREAVPLEEFQRAALPAVALLQAFLPGLLGHPTNDAQWFQWWLGLGRGAGVDPLWTFNFVEANLYSGVAPLFLAMAALIASRRQPLTRYFGVLAGLTLLAATGGWLADSLYWLLPTFRHSRPERVLFLYFFALPVLASLGYERLAAEAWDRHRSRRVFAVCGSVFVSLGCVAALYLLSRPGVLRAGRRFLDERGLAGGLESLGYGPGFWTEMLLVLASLALCWVLAFGGPGRGGSGARSGLWVLAIALPSFVFGWRFNPVQRLPLFPETQTIARLSRGDGLYRIARFRAATYVPANTAQRFGLFDVNGASTAGLANYLGLITALDPGAVLKQKYFRDFRQPAVLPSRLLDLLNVRYLLSGESLGLPVVAEVPGTPWRVYERSRFLPRFFLSRRAVVYDDASQARSLLTSAGFDPGVVLVARSEAHAVSDLVDAPSGNDAVNVERYSSRRIDLSVRSDSRAILASSEVQYPGWRVSIDGTEVPILLVDTAFRGVVVPPGNHRVRFDFVPRSFWAGGAVAAVSLLGALLAARARNGKGRS